MRSPLKDGELWVAFKLDKDHADLVRAVQLIEGRSIRNIVRSGIQKQAHDHGLRLPIPTGLRP